MENESTSGTEDAARTDQAPHENEEGAESSHGETLMKAVLYTRVSTEEQGKSGYSLGQQREALRAYCKDQGLEVVGEFEDQSSGASLDRPGMDDVRDVVSAGGVHLVLVQDRDRFSREPAHIHVLREEFMQYGTTLRALNDRGDHSPEGELTDGILDQLAKYERAKTAERTRRGRIKKAQEGKIVGTGKPPYGFYYADNHYHVDPDRMPFVHEIFEMVVNGHSIYEVTRHLRKVGAPSPGGGEWYRSAIRPIVLNDTYLGTYWWGRQKKTYKTVSEVVNGERVYKKKVVKEDRPRENWIAIPVPDSGIPPETIARAREMIGKHAWTVSRNSERTWELSGGVAVCSGCGSHLTAYSTSNSGKNRKKYFYYRCPNRGPSRCSNRKNYPADALEAQVRDTLAGTFQEETWTEFVNKTCDRQLEDLRKLLRSDPQKTRESLVKRIGALETKMTRLVDLFTDGDISKETYREKKSAIEELIAGSHDELSKIDDLGTEMERIEGLRTALLALENPFSGHYVFVGDVDPNVLVDHNLSYGSKETAARRRQELYGKVGLRVSVGGDVEISLNVGGTLVSKLDDPSCRTRRQRRRRPR